MNKIKLSQISIKWKIYLYLLGFCAVLISVLWLFQVVFLESFYKSIKISSVKYSATTIVNNINNSKVDRLIREISQENEVCIEVLSSNGNTLYSSEDNINCMIHKMDNREKQVLINKALENYGESLDYYNKDDFRENKYDPNFFIDNMRKPMEKREDTIIFSKVLEDSNGNQLFLLINSEIRPVDATVSTLRVQLYYITGFMVLFSIIVAFIISKKVSKPIEEINETSKGLGEGAYNIEFKSTGYKEISELSNTLTKASKELSKVENLRRELIANISHDLRTPLTLIGGYAEIMRDVPGENSKENAQVIIDETKRLTTLVNDVLDISKLQSGAQTLNKTRFNITETFNEITKRLETLTSKEGFKINFEYSKKISIIGDKSKLCQVFYNLLINAINYSGEDKRVVAIQKIYNDFVVFEIKDTGEGIGEELIPYIWERYYKGDKNYKRAVTGTGLGLSIVRSIVELHGGKYGVNSSQNEGSTFWFSIKLES